MDAEIGCALAYSLLAGSLVIIAVLVTNYKKDREAKREINSVRYPEIVLQVKNWAECHENPDTSFQALKKEISNGQQDECLIEDALKFVMWQQLVDFPFDLRNSYNLGRLLQGGIIADDLTPSCLRKIKFHPDPQLFEITDYVGLKQGISRLNCIVKAVIFCTIFTTVLVTAIDWVSDVLQNLSAYISTKGQEGTSVLFYMQAHIPLFVLAASTFFLLLSRPWVLLSYNVRVMIEYARDGNIHKYDALNRFQFGTTQGGLESFPQLMMQASTYLSVASLAASNDSKFLCIDEEEIENLSETYTFGPFLAISVMASLVSISIFQYSMVNGQYSPSLFDSLVWNMTALGCVISSVTLSFMVVDTVSVVLDLLTVTTCRSTDNASIGNIKWLTISLFLIAPGLISFWYDWVLGRTVDIVEDDFKSESVSFTCNTFHKMKGFCMVILEGLFSKLRLPSAQLFTYYEKGYKCSFSPKSDKALERLFDHCVFWTGMLIFNIAMKLLCLSYDYTPSDCSIARWRFQISCTIVVPCGWLLSHVCLIPRKSILCQMYPENLSYEGTVQNDAADTKSSDEGWSEKLCSYWKNIANCFCNWNCADRWSNQFKVEKIKLEGKWMH